MTPAPARLLLRYGPYAAQEYPLPEHTITVGREPVNDVVLSDPEISRRHARIMYQAGRYVLEDLGSTNGTSVNGRRLTEPTVLNAGDVIDFAEYVAFTFELAESAGYADTIMDAGRRAPSSPATAVRPRPVADVPGHVPPAPGRSEPAAATRQVERPYSPVATRQTEPFPPGAAPRRGRSTRILVGCGCLLFLLAFLCATTLFLLDARAPELLYCGPLRPFFEPLLRLAGRTLLC
jgi:predicted component of type VI protein secretion system